MPRPDPPTWAYEFETERKQRELQTFDSIVNDVSGLLTSGSAVDRMAAENRTRQVQQAKARTQVEQRRRQRISELARAQVERQQERKSGGGSLLGGIGDRLGDAAEGTLSALGHLDRPRGAALGFLTGDNPVESVQQAVEGFKEPDRFSGEDLGFVRQLPEGSRARQVAGRVGEELVDPLNLAVALGGAGAAARLAPRAGRVGRAAAAFIEPISTGNRAQRIGAEAGAALAARTAGEQINERLPENTPGGLRAAAALGGGLLGAGAAIQGARGARAAGGAALDAGARRATMGLEQALEGPISTRASGFGAQPIMGGVERPPFRFMEAEEGLRGEVRTLTNLADPEAVPPRVAAAQSSSALSQGRPSSGVLDGEPVYGNQFAIVFGEKPPASFKGGDPADLDKVRLIRDSLITESAQSVEPGVRIERSAARELPDVVQMRSGDGSFDAFFDTRYVYGIAGRHPGAVFVSEMSGGSPMLGVKFGDRLIGVVAGVDETRHGDLRQMAGSASARFRGEGFTPTPDPVNRGSQLPPPRRDLAPPRDRAAGRAFTEGGALGEERLAEVLRQRVADTGVELEPSLRAALDSGKLSGSQRVAIREKLPELPASRDVQLRGREQGAVAATGREQTARADRPSAPAVPTREANNAAALEQSRARMAERPEIVRRAEAAGVKLTAAQQRRVTAGESLSPAMIRSIEKKVAQAEPPARPAIEPLPPRPEIVELPPQYQGAELAPQIEGPEPAPVNVGSSSPAQPESATPPVPPIEPPGAGDTPPPVSGGNLPPPTPPHPTGDSRYEMPEQGRAGAEQMLATKEETLLHPELLGSKVMTYPILRSLPPNVAEPVQRTIEGLVSVLNPSVGMDRRVLVAYNARTATRARLGTDFTLRYAPVSENLRAAWADAPEYVGPADNPFRHTIKDAADHPEFYALGDAHRAALDELRSAGVDILRELRGRWGADVLPFVPANADAVYLPNVNIADEVLAALDKTASDVAGGRARAKHRLHQGAYDRWKLDPKFKAETDVDALLENHAHAMAGLASDETFRMGTGGLTRIKLVEKLHPGLREARDEMAVQIQSLRGKLARAEERSAVSGRSARRTGSELRQVEGRAAPLAERADELLEDRSYGAELSYLSGQVRELEGRASALRRSVLADEARASGAEARVPDLREQVRQLTPQLDRLRARYNNANTEPWVLNQRTHRYYEAPISQQIDTVLATRLGPPGSYLDKLLNLVDEIRQIAFAGDMSPIFIQGGMAMMAAPRNAVKAMSRYVEAIRDGYGAVTTGQSKGIIKNATRQVLESEPETVARYTTATGRQFGQLGQEFHQANRGLSRIPRWRQAEESMMGALELVMYDQWKRDVELVQRWYPGLSQDVIDAETANVLSKIVPRLQAAETGRSVLRNRLDRSYLTSPSFMLGPAALVKDVTSGLVKLATAQTMDKAVAWQAMAPREQLAILRFRNFMGTALAASTASALLFADANNLSPEEAVAEVLDPRSGRFMSLIIADKGTIGLGGPMRGLLRAFAPRKDREGELAPFGGMIGFLRGKLNVLPSTTIDILQDRDYFGNEIAEGGMTAQLLDRLMYGFERVLPISAGQVFAGYRTGASPTETVIAAAGDFMGQNVYTRRAQEELDRISRGRYDAEFFSLTRAQQQVIKRDHPGLWTRVVEAGNERRQEAERLRLIKHSQQALDDESLLSGSFSKQDWRTNYQDRMTELRGAYEAIYGSDPIANPRNPFERYIQQIQLHEQPNGTVDWDAVSDWRDSQSDEDQRYIDENTGVDRTPVAQVWRAVSKIRSRQFDIPLYRGYTADEGQQIDDLWDVVRNNARSTDDRDMIRAYRQVVPSSTPSKIAKGVRARIMGTLNRSKARDRFRAQHPEIDLFYGDGPLNPAQMQVLERVVQRVIARQEAA